MALQWFWDWEMHWWCSLLCPPNLSINMENSLGMTHPVEKVDWPPATDRPN